MDHGPTEFDYLAHMGGAAKLSQRAYELGLSLQVNLQKKQVRIVRRFDKESVFSGSSYAQLEAFLDGCQYCKERYID